MLNALTFDIEEWYHGNLFHFAEPQIARFPSRVGPPTMAILDMLAASGKRATFFFLGVVARDHPELVRRAASEGHEIACHGWEHRLLYTMPGHEIKRDLLKAKGLLEDISGVPVRGFRAPSWSMSRRSTELLRLVSECGFHYDSSVFPAGTPFIGVSGIPPKPVLLSGDDGARRWSIIEFPAPSFGLGRWLRVPFGGGLFLRVWPYSLTRAMVQSMNKGGSRILVYVHPWELDTSLPAGVPPLLRLARDWGVPSTRFKLTAVLRDSTLGTMIDALRDEGLHD
ncbi:MAG: polysaccharide deacetylase family protein [Bacillota bacterium]